MTNRILYNVLMLKLDEVKTVEGIKAYKMTVADDIAYIMFNDYYANEVKYYKYDLKNEKLLSDNFITDGTVVSSPNGIGRSGNR